MVLESQQIKVTLLSLGCNKNLVDSEVMLGLLEREGYLFVADPDEADVLIVNTCGFIEEAKKEAVETIVEMGTYKEQGRCRSLIVTGCLVQRYADELAQELPEIDALLGTGDFHRIVPVVEETLAGRQCRFTGPPRARFPGQWPRLLSQAGPSAYLKIAEGCNNHCSYCIIPQLRGPLQSRSQEDIVEEAQALAQLGIKEVILIAQDTTRYGEDIYGEPALPELLRRLARIEGISWIRLLYCYPSRLSPQLIKVFKEEPKVLHYVDIPLQHVSNRILARMNRKQTKEEILALIERLRTEIPDIAIRTSFIVGFPGETEAEFAELLDFIAEVRFDRAGFFIYSQEEGTPAAAYRDQLPEKEKKLRYDAAMELQRSISAEKNRQWLGKELDVLLEGKGPDEGLMVGRSYRDAPEIDGLIYVAAPEEAWGNIVKVQITGVDDYDLRGEVRGEFGQ